MDRRERGADRQIDRQTDTAGKWGTDRLRDRRWWGGGLDRRERGRQTDRHSR